MFSSKEDIISKIHLLISLVIVVPVAIVYGFFPETQFEIFPKTVDEHNFQKAIMGIYLAFSFLWIVGIFKKEYLQLAIVTNIIFMLGLGFGRIVSILTDGIPTFGFQFGVVGELVLGFYGLWVLKKKKVFLQKN